MNPHPIPAPTPEDARPSHDSGSSTSSQSHDISVSSSPLTSPHSKNTHCHEHTANMATDHLQRHDHSTILKSSSVAQTMEERRAGKELKLQPAASGNIFKNATAATGTYYRINTYVHCSYFIYVTDKRPVVESTGTSGEGRRIVLHVDMDCFFVSVLLRDLPHLKLLPVVVAHGSSSAGYSEVSSCNYVARSFGVKNGSLMKKAKEVCPQLVVLPYDFAQYEIVSEQMYRVFYSLPQVVTIQPVSIDEAYLEFSTNAKYTSENTTSFSEIQDTSSRGMKIARYIRRRLFVETKGCPSSVGVSGKAYTHTCM